jgi:hypothetical protein
MADKAPSKADSLRAMREANYAANHTNPVSKATKAKPSGLDAKGPSKTPVIPADRVASRLGAGRTVQDAPRLETAEAVAIQKGGPKSPRRVEASASRQPEPSNGPAAPIQSKRGRPRLSDTTKASRATKYRRQKEAKE